jgi:UDP-N-acetylmuramate-alanine ligase
MSANIVPTLPKRIHLIGICGVAMSALPIAFHEKGVKVSGSDKGYTRAASIAGNDPASWSGPWLEPKAPVYALAENAALARKNNEPVVEDLAENRGEGQTVERDQFH